MVFSKEQYREYYEKTKAERNRKRREKYLSQKSRVDEIKVGEVDETFINQVDENRQPKLEVDEKMIVDKVDEKRVDEKRVDEKNRPPKKLWKDYYSVKKPFCPNCIKNGIREDEYNFCSIQKQPVKIYETDFWGQPIKNKILHTFANTYECIVYHWTIYQGQGKI